MAKLQCCHDAGAVVDYLNSHRNPDDMARDVLVLRTHGFPARRVLARRPGESYGDVVGREALDVLIEGDCQSIGPSQITYSQIPTTVRTRIKSIIVPEFGGIDHLPTTPRPANFRALSMRNARS
jgi:hypothetical protein